MTVMRNFDAHLHNKLRDSVLQSDSSIVTILKQFKELSEIVGCTEDADYAKAELDGYPLDSFLFREVGCNSIYFRPSVPFPDYREIRDPIVVGCVTNSFYPQKQVSIENIEILKQIGVKDGIWPCTNGMVECEELLKVPAEKVTLFEVSSIDGWCGRIRDVKVLSRRGEISKMINSVKEEVRRRIAKSEKYHKEFVEAIGMQPNIAVNISGNNNQVTTSGHDLKVHSVTQKNEIRIGKGDWGSVERVLLEQKISKEDIDGLRQALIDEPELPATATRERPTFGDKVSGWLGMILKKALDGMYDIGSDVVAGLLTQVIARYYGL